MIESFVEFAQPVGEVVDQGMELLGPPARVASRASILPGSFGAWC
jgi:hypothetical protein